MYNTTEKTQLKQIILNQEKIAKERIIDIDPQRDFFLIHMPTCLVKVEVARMNEAKKVKATKIKTKTKLFFLLVK